MITPKPPKLTDTKNPEELKEKEAGPGLGSRLLSVMTLGFFGGGAKEATKEPAEAPDTSLPEREMKSDQKRAKPVLASSPLAIPDDSFSKDFVAGYNERIYDKQAKNWDVIFTKLESVFSNFDRSLYAGNPTKFIADMSNQYDAGIAFDKAISSDETFVEAWDAITNEQSTYYRELVDQYYGNDAEYQKKTKRYDVLTDIFDKKIDETLGVDETDLDAYMRACEDFEDKYGEEYEQLSQYCHDKENAHFNAMVTTYNAKNKKFQDALGVIQTTKESIQADGPEEMTEALYEKYRAYGEFKEAIDYIDEQEATFRKMLRFPYTKEEVEEKRAIRSPRLDWTTLRSEAAMLRDDFQHQAEIAKKSFKEGAFNGAEFVKKHPGAILTPGVGIAAYLLASPIAVPAYAVGSVFLAYLGQKGISAGLAYLKEEGVFEDLKAAKEDREIRRPYLEKIFSQPVTSEKKLSYMNELHKSGLLFKEDLASIGDAALKAEFFKGIEGGEKGLPSLITVAEARKPYLQILREGHSPDELKVEALKGLHEKGLLYKSDIGQDSIDDTVKENFFAALDIDESDLKDLKTQKDIRNTSLFLIKGGVKLNQDERFGLLKELHKQGLLFKQDLDRLENTDVIEGKELMNRLRADESIKLLYLPDLTAHYKRQELSLRRADDQKRSPFLKELDNEDPAIQLEGLHGLQKLGLCFDQDLEKVGEIARQSFKEENSFAPLIDQDTYYKTGVSDRLVRVGTAMVSLIKKGGIAVYNDPVNVVYGPLKAIKVTVEVSAEAMDETFGSFLYQTTALQDRVGNLLPTDAKLKRLASFSFNKVIGTMKWGVLGGAIGGAIGSTFGLTVQGMQIGGMIGSAYGAYTTDGRVNQLPPGGMIRAVTFSAKGALVGSVVPIVLGAVTLGLALGGVIALGTALSVASMGLSLIIPCLLFGAWAGYQIAGLTAKEEATTPDSVIEGLAYEAPSLEFAEARL